MSGPGEIPQEKVAVLICFSFALVLVLLFSSTFTVVHPGEVGIVVTLGHVTVFPPGANFRPPFISRLERMSTKTQLLELARNAIPTREGLSVTLDTAVLYRVNPDRAGDLYKNVGLNYCNVLIEPEAASAVRGLTSEKEAKALYTSGRNEIQEAVKDELEAKLGPRGIIVEVVLLKDVQLPPDLTKSIELKAKAEQDSARMEFVLSKERQEADRKAIEAKGIASFQKIVSDGISANLLKWKGIEATEKFADSTNTKIIIVGNEANGLPVLFSASDESPDHSQ